MRTRKEEEDRERERERIRKEKERETPAQKGGQKRAATVEQVKHEIREMLREGYQDIDIQAAITQKYPDVAEEALSGLK
jgi:cytochrome c-type biogenesis protein CcmH/NrfF